MYTYAIPLEAQWPIPCEYVQPTILASEFPSSSIFKQSNLYISSGTGVEYYNIIKSISGLSTGSSFFLTGFNNNSYTLDVSEKTYDNNLLIINGDVNSYYTDPFASAFGTLGPSISVVNGSGLFSFTRSLQGYNYTIEYTKDLNSSWTYTGITLSPASSQSGVPAGYIKEQFYYPLVGTIFFRMKSVSLASEFVGNFELIQNGNSKLLTVALNNSTTNSVYYIFSTGSGNATFIEDNNYTVLC